MSVWSNGKKIYKAIELADIAMREADALANLVFTHLEEKIAASNDIHFINVKGSKYFDIDLKKTLTEDVTTDWANSFFIKRKKSNKNTELTIQIQYSLYGENMTSEGLVNEEPLIFVGISDRHDPIEFDPENCYSIKNILLPTTRILTDRFLTNRDNDAFSYYCYALRLTSVNNQQDVLNKIVEPVLKMAELRLMKVGLTSETLDELALKIGSGMAKFLTTNGQHSISFQD